MTNSVAMSTASNQNGNENFISHYKYPEFLGEMGDSRFGAGNVEEVS